MQIEVRFFFVQKVCFLKILLCSFSRLYASVYNTDKRDSQCECVPQAVNGVFEAPRVTLDRYGSDRVAPRLCRSGEHLSVSWPSVYLFFQKKL